jgi:hypothetical protein
MALRFAQPLTKMSTGIYFWGKARPARKAGMITVTFDSVGSLTSYNPIGLKGITFTLTLYGCQVLKIRSAGQNSWILEEFVVLS